MKKHIYLLVICSLLPAALLFSGCGDSQDQSTVPAQNQSASAQSNSSANTAAAGAANSAAGAGSCPVVDGQQAATALGGTFVGSKEVANPPANQVHCTLNLQVAGAEKVFVIWRMPAGDYANLKSSEADSVIDVTGVGEQAFITFHPGEQRFDMAAMNAGKFTVEVTGDDQLQVKQLVSLILAQY
ncbi:MAG: hypothetical protein ACYCXF_08985 [Thermoleophilia bacterium]